MELPFELSDRHIDKSQRAGGGVLVRFGDGCSNRTLDLVKTNEILVGYQACRMRDDDHAARRVEQPRCFRNAKVCLLLLSEIGSD
ncbi:MAG: hypothetical protein AAF432_00335 [Planctomycetota bacterium]